MSIERFARSSRLRSVFHSIAALIALATLAVGAPARAADSGWPRQFDSPNGSFVIYQPQPEDLDRDLLECRAAFSLQKPGNLEREFRARQRAGEQRAPSVAPPRPKPEPAKPAPAKPAPEPPKNPFKRKP